MKLHCKTNEASSGNNNSTVKVKRAVPLRSVGGVLISLSRPLSP